MSPSLILALILSLAFPVLSQQISTPAPAPPAAPRPAPVAPQASTDPHEIQLREDFPWLQRFHALNATVPAPGSSEQRIVFMGDSITQGWANNGIPNVFTAEKPWLNRGISGQTTPQMLLRFRQDVIDLKPRVVVIFAGTNDIAGNTGDMTLQATEDNLASMAELAQANGIQVVLCSVLPAYDFPWKPGREPAPKIIAINAWIKSYAKEKGFQYADFYSAMVDERGGLPPTLSKDGVHPNPAGYAIMNPLAEAAITKALTQK